MHSDTNEDDKMRMGEFVGFTKNEFKNIKESLGRIEKKLEDTCNLSEQNKLDITTIKAQAGLFGSLAGAGASIIVAGIMYLAGK